MSAGPIYEIDIAGVLREQVTLAANTRVRMHFLATKVGTEGGPKQFTAYFGTTHNSFMRVPPFLDLGSLVNVYIDTPVDDQFLKYNGTYWINEELGAISLHSDVDTVSVAPTLNQALIWNNTNWVPGTVAATFLSLTDVPSDYTTYAGYAVIVNPAEDALIFGTFSSVVIYNNATPMPEAVGGYEIGTTFTDQDNTEMWDGLLYPYQYPAFTSFLISGQATTLECGIEIAAGNHTFTWSVTNDSNIDAASLVVRDVTGATDLATGLNYDDSPAVIDIGVAITKTTTATLNQWKITGTNSQAGTFTRNFNVYWYSPFYYGSGAQALTTTQIQALTKQVVSKSNKTYTFNPTVEVFYFAYPASYGVLTSILDPNGFETISDWTLRVENFNNNSPDYEGITVSYNIYEFNSLTTQVNFNNTFIF